MSNLNQRKLDAHAHVFYRSDKSIPDARYVPNYDATLDNWLAMLDANALEGGTLVQPSFLGTDNERLLKSINEARNRGYDVDGAAVVAPTIEQEDLEALIEQKIVALRLNMVERPLMDFKSDCWARFFELVQSTNLSIEIHLEANRMLTVLETLQQYEIDLVLDHYALVESVEKLEHLLSNVDTNKISIKRSAPYRLPIESVLDRNQIASCLDKFLLQYFPLDKTPVGTDWPHTRFEHLDLNQPKINRPTMDFIT